MKTIYKADYILYEDEMKEGGYLICEDQRVVDYVDHLPVTNEVTMIDYSGYIIAPGLVDTHIHGYGGYDVMDCSPEGMEQISKGLLECGVTSWLATTLTDSPEHLMKACQVVGESASQVTGARIQGIFLEGPFFTEKYKGAQNAKYMQDPSIDLLNQWNHASDGMVRKIAIAPERKGVQDFIKKAVEQGIYVALGHSDATYNQAYEAVEAGANIFVHLYNGMRGLHHREPGMVGAGLTLDEAYAEIIADGHHVHPKAIQVVTQAKPQDKVILISDCMRAGGLDEGESRLGEFEVIVKDGQARLKDSGNLAGSVLKLIQAVHNLVDWDIVNLTTALKMGSLYPAQSVGLDKHCGRLSANYPADFIVIEPQGKLYATYLANQRVYCRQDA
ncbi:N-acetylglucosamine-6-phosphate deacetylase [Falseniella ignava]|uniref:N-acetylglucosamine-6-phosphate deacetylase n=1 Tax=Falseniella ignava CCUG 37419 TaxID=883112 RepID=K1MCU8_9LACT|nr:N-acetylglucosamine-6-phosphate deacetylase [Falseniella ignava]EKB53814.1 N-acetylglucosamine-6-phosphate deacetylase [Falseniella ignava CCUG 37419]